MVQYNYVIRASDTSGRTVLFPRIGDRGRFILIIPKALRAGFSAKNAVTGETTRINARTAERRIILLEVRQTTFFLVLLLFT